MTSERDLESPTCGTSAAPELVLRPATAEDRSFLLTLYASIRADELALTDWSEEQKAAFVEQQFSAQDRFYREHYPDASFDVVEADGEPVGRLYVDRWSDEIRLMDVALVPEARGRGIGERLVRRLMAEAAGADQPLTIHVERFNRAFSLYARLGFEVAEDKGVYLFLRWTPPRVS